MGLLLEFHRNPMAFLWHFQDVSLIFLWDYQGDYMGFLWDFFVVPMPFPCHFCDLFYGISVILYVYGITMGCELKVSLNDLTIN